MNYDELEDLAYDIAEDFEKLNVDYIKEVGTHIKKIGKNISSFDMIIEFVAAHKIATNFKRKLDAKCVQLSRKINSTYNDILISNYKEVKPEYISAYGFQVPLTQNKQLLKYLDSINYKTIEALSNISRTTVVDTTYISKINSAVNRVTQGFTDYESATRKIVKEAGTGAKVVYQSGATRRLDSAVRMNILDGMRTVNQGVREIAGQQFGADGYEISAHALCAPDHLDIEGQQYSIEQFESVNGSLDRQIGTCNCKHTYFPIILGISKPAYSDSELQDIKELATKPIEIDGVTKTRYEWSQEQRKLETAMRKTKEQVIIAKSAGDIQLEQSARQKLQNLKYDYNNVSKGSGLSPNYKRASVPGFK